MAQATEYPDVDVATREDLVRGIQHALDRLGMTIEQLTAQGEAGSFTSEQARLLWLAITPPERRAAGCC